jgi:hypothetical protein
MTYRGTARLVVALALAAAPARPAAAQARPGGKGPPGDTLAIVHGTVVEHEGGGPLAGASVSLAAGPRGTPGIGTRVTDDDGRFLFQEVPPGTYTLVIELLGRLTRTDTLPVDAGVDLGLAVELAVSAVPLDPIVVVVARRPTGALAGFEERRRTHVGSFLTREQIEEKHPRRMSDLLRGIPGIRLVPAGSYGYDVRLRGNCRPDLWIDGVRTASAVPVDLAVTPIDVEAVEVYRTSEVPIQFGASPCGVIAVWTRAPQPATGDGPHRRNLLIAVAVVFVGWLLAR